MSASAAIVRSWRVGRYTCTLSLPERLNSGRLNGACIEWAPYVPQRLTDAEIEQYKAGRNRALAELAQTMGGNVAVIDL